MKVKKVWILIYTILIFLSIWVAGIVYAINTINEGFIAPIGWTPVKVNAYSTCKIVSNKSSIWDAFIPTKTSTEWTDLIAKNPSHLDITNISYFDQNFSGSWDNLVNNLEIQTDGKIMIVWDITSYAWVSRNRIARLNVDGTLDTTFNPGTWADNTVTISITNTAWKIYIWWTFITYNGTSRNRVARLNANGTLDTTFNPWTGANGDVRHMAMQTDGKIIIVWDFTTYNGTARNRIARVNTDGTLDTTFNPWTWSNWSIWRILIQSDGYIIIWWNLTSYAGTARSRIARLNSNGTLDTSFNPWSWFNGNVYAMTLDPTWSIIVTWVFTSYNGTARNRIARIAFNGNLDTSFNPWTGANNNTWPIEVLPNWKILVGGYFTSFNGTTWNIVRLYYDWSMDESFNPSPVTLENPTSFWIIWNNTFIVGWNFNSLAWVTNQKIAKYNFQSCVNPIDKNWYMIDSCQVSFNQPCNWAGPYTACPYSMYSFYPAYYSAPDGTFACKPTDTFCETNTPFWFDGNIKTIYNCQ